MRVRKREITDLMTVVHVLVKVLPDLEQVLGTPCKHDETRVKMRQKFVFWLEVSPCERSLRVM